MKAATLLFPLLAVAVVSGCLSQGSAPPAAQEVSQQAASACIRACTEFRDAGAGLDMGPCLSDAGPDMPEGWVCDVAHSPRQAVDNDPANQCPAFGRTASHFVEVRPDCTLLGAY
jgi:hypothetical protein